jgi:hypothetical protein
LEPEEFIGCCKLAQGKVKEKLAAKHGIKGKVLAQAGNDLLAGTYVESRKAPSLEAI